MINCKQSLSFHSVISEQMLKNCRSAALIMWNTGLLHCLAMHVSLTMKKQRIQSYCGLIVYHRTFDKDVIQSTVQMSHSYRPAAQLLRLETPSLWQQSMRCERHRSVSRRTSRARLEGAFSIPETDDGARTIACDQRQVSTKRCINDITGSV